MPAPKIRADYQALQRMATLFRREGQGLQQTLSRLQRQLGTLQSGEWVGRGADKFYQEMDSDVLPSFQRMGAALGQAASAADRIKQIMQQAEEEVARLFKWKGDGSGTPKAAMVGEEAGEGGSSAGGSQAQPASEAEQAVRRMLIEQWPPIVVDTANLSPTLRGQLHQLEQDGWIAVEASEGEGTQAIHPNKVMTLGYREEWIDMVPELAAAAGDATYGGSPNTAIGVMERDDFLDHYTELSYRQEAAADLNYLIIADEIRSNGGPEIGLPSWEGKLDSPEYQSIYQDYQSGAIDRQETLNRIVEQTRSEGRDDRYRQQAANLWDQENAN